MTPADAARRRPVRRAAAIALLLGACHAPDYTPVRDWARTASLAADYPAAADASADGFLALQEALVTWLAALGRMADDGVLPYPEDPFADLAARAARADARGGEAVAALGRTLRHATRNNLRAPALRDTIRGNDAAVQTLVGSMRLLLAGTPSPPHGPAAAGDAAAIRGRYLAILEQVAAAHAMLREKAGRITEEEMAARIRAAEDQLRRAARALPLPNRPLAGHGRA